MLLLVNPLLSHYIRKSRCTNNGCYIPKTAEVAAMIYRSMLIGDSGAEPADRSGEPWLSQLLNFGLVSGASKVIGLVFEGI